MSSRGPKDGYRGAWVSYLSNGARGAHESVVGDKEFHGGCEQTTVVRVDVSR
jgi:hypothetical protein